MDESSLINRIISHFPFDLSVKFVYRYLINDDSSNIIDLINISLREYQHRIENIYNTHNKNKYLNFTDKLNFTDLFSIVENEELHSLIDNTNKIIHINSNSKKSIQKSLNSLLLNGYIPIDISLRKCRRIFTMKYYKSYYLAGNVLLKPSYN